ncbi:hypothetical protein D3C81_1563530 [compost metagenome]
MLLVKQVADIQRKVSPLGNLVIQRRIKQRCALAFLGVGGIHVVSPHVPRPQPNAHVSIRDAVVAPQRSRMLRCSGEFFTLERRAVVQRTAQHFGLHIRISADHADVLRHLRFCFQVEAAYA